VYHHAKTDAFSLLFNVGGSPGNAIRDTAANFEDVIGVNGSVEMIINARSEGGDAGSWRATV